MFGFFAGSRRTTLMGGSSVLDFDLEFKG